MISILLRVHFFFVFLLHWTQLSHQDKKLVILNTVGDLLKKIFGDLTFIS